MATDWLLLRAMILWIGWPILIGGSVIMAFHARRFHHTVGRTVFGRLLLLLVAGWFSTMYALGLTATAFMLRDPEVGVPVVLPVFISWGLSMVLVVVGLQWSKEAAELNRFYQSVQEMERFKSQFLSSTAHELGTPLTPIGIQLHLLRGLRSPAAEPQLHQSLDVMERNFSRLVRIVNEVQDAGRLQNKRLVLRPTRVDLHAVIAKSAGSMEPVARQARLDLKVEPGRPLFAVADGERLGQVLDNLLSNAIKYTPAGGRIRVAAYVRGGEAWVEVTDTGLGLDPDQMPRLFQPYSQLGQPLSGRPPGTGLGLYICKGIIEQHGGRIWAHSDGVGKGSAFCFTLPIAAAGRPHGGGSAE